MDSRVFDLTDDEVLPPGETPLSEREQQVADLILAELSSTQIAERLFISFNTVETHRKHIYQKLGVQSRTEAIAQALEKLGFLHSLPLN